MSNSIELAGVVFVRFVTTQDGVCRVFVTDKAKNYNTASVGLFDLTSGIRLIKKKPKIRSKIAIPLHYLPISERIKGFKEVNLGYKSMDEVLKECERCYQCFSKQDPSVKPPPCMETCPTHCNSREIIKNILDENIDEALRIIYEHYALPRSVERVCPGYCQLACTAGKKGDPIQIPLIKRYIVDNFKPPDDFLKCNEDINKKVAIIGSGPLGLTAATYLRKHGVQVTIFEKLNVIGGVLAAEIPEFRLPKSILNEEIENLKKFNIEFKINTGINDENPVETLFNFGFNAIIIGIGTYQAKWIKISGEDAPIILQALDFLRNYNLKQEIPLLEGKKVIVIGGGSTATDAARVAKRLGADVSIIYRRQKEQMPAGIREIQETEEEGIKIKFLTQPTEFLCHEDEFQGAVCEKLKLGDIDDSGRPKPVPIEDSEFKIEADYIIEAIGQEPNLIGFDKNKFEVTKWNTFIIDKDFCTSVMDILAGGDCVTGSKSVIHAVAHGKLIADQIYKEFKKSSLQ